MTTTNMTRFKRHKSAFAGLFVLVILVTVTGCTAIKDRLGLNSTETIATTSDEDPFETETSCPFPLKDVPEYAMSFGLPPGWTGVHDGGTLTISEDEQTSVVIYTAKLERDLSAEEFLTEFGDIFETTIEGAGGSFSLNTPTGTGDDPSASDPSDPGYYDTEPLGAEEDNFGISDGLAVSSDTAMATVSATIDGDELQGVFTTEKEPGFVTFKGYWARAGEFATKESELKQVAGCYKRSTALTEEQLVAGSAARDDNAGGGANTDNAGNDGISSQLVPRTDGEFTFKAPQSWSSSVSGGGDTSSLIIEAPEQDASVAFIFNLGRYGAADPAEFAQETLGILGIQASLTNHQTLSGGIESYEFNGSFSGKAVSGIISVRIEPWQTFFAHYVGIQVATADKWSEYAPTLNAIQSSIYVTDVGEELSSLPPLPDYSTEALFGSSVTSSYAYKQEVEDRASLQWEEGMLGWETVENPKTGDRYDITINAFNPTGPEGGGYYAVTSGGNDYTKLEPVYR